MVIIFGLCLDFVPYFRYTDNFFLQINSSEEERDQIQTRTIQEISMDLLTLIYNDNCTDPNESYQ